MVTPLKRILSAALALLVAAACILMLFWRIPRRVPAGTVLCRWESGEREEPYAAALASFAGIEDGAILLERGGTRGTVGTGEAFARAHAILETGGLLELLTLNTYGLAPIERAALYLAHRDTLYYTRGVFRFDGNKVSPSDMVAAKRVVLLDGSLPSCYLRDTGAAQLVLRTGAEITAADLAGSAVESVAAEPPYAAEGEAVYLDTAGGRRFVAALPKAAHLTVSDCAFADEGALAAARGLISLELPFVGNAKEPFTGFDGSLSWLFSAGGGAAVPPSLTSLKVRGGTVDAFAFRGSEIQELDLCGILAENISPQAFSEMPALKYLHTRCTDALPEEFSRRTAPCGCTVYERA